MRTSLSTFRVHAFSNACPLAALGRDDRPERFTSEVQVECIVWEEFHNGARHVTVVIPLVLRCIVDSVREGREL